ncbi:YciI family protein [Shewanella sp. D64]|uniref:YciI family protein n=1 Tax=unclassified Shewanella TaxID=196818 RepID=UPI0022BA642F|nr:MULTISPECIES: YciI family protein [unclassified Shewanella]MEC4724052.1 YciI family protein [Shewanella sp. D64]MEC4736072.1 YciI family protein [Shewanella sp. E94]WBJ97984.1 YciI family protein [Shewanella sp. MTB7]
MSKLFLCMQRSESGTCESSSPSPSQMEAMYAKFNAWKDKYGNNIVDMGGKLNASGKVVKHDSVIDGPFMESKEIIGGFMIISADTLEFAMEIVQASPGVAMPGSSVEIREIHKP